jgi:phage terminase small subunit
VWVKERVLLELKRIGEADIRKIFDEDGNIKPVHEWPNEVAAFVSSIETVEEFEGSGKDREQIGWNKKVKLWNKERALELLGKNIQMFTDKIEHSGKLTLEDLVNASWDKKKGEGDE